MVDSSVTAEATAETGHLEIQAARPTFEMDDIEALQAGIVDALRDGVLTQGPHAAAFEAAFASYCGVAHAVAVSSGTAALELTLRALDVRDAEVVVPTNTFIATANAVAIAGGRPVFADLQPESLCVGVKDVAHVMTSRTVGVVVVHIAGLICPEIDQIRELCRARGVFVVEDAAHAHGACSRSGRAGSLAAAAAFSFFPTKPMTTGEGGMITTDHTEIARVARLARSHGLEPTTGLHVAWGTNYRMAEIPALLGLQQLRRLGAHLERRRAIARLYTEALATLTQVHAIYGAEDEAHAYYKYPLVTPERDLSERLRAALAQHGIPTGSVYATPCHLQPYARVAYGAQPGDCPRAEQVLPRVICLPIHAMLPLDRATWIGEVVVREARSLGLA